MSDSINFQRHELADGLYVLTCRLPDSLRLPPERFEEFWAMHPPDPPAIVLQGERMLAPRWHQAFGRDYEFAGAVSQAVPVPPILQPMLAWTQCHVDARTNGILVNSSSQRVANLECRDAAEIAVQGPEFCHAMLQAQRGDPRIVDPGSKQLGPLQHRSQRCPMARAFAKQHDTRCRKPRLDLCHGLGHGRRRGVDFRVGYDCQELVHARPWQSPTARGFCEFAQYTHRRAVPGRVLAMGIYQEVGVNCDHVPRPW